jgi:hypothetical protein
MLASLKFDHHVALKVSSASPVRALLFVKKPALIVIKYNEYHYEVLISMHIAHSIARK